MATPTTARESTASPSPVAEQVAGLRATFAAGSTRSYTWRIRQLESIERLLTEREPDIAAALAADLGRSAEEAWLGDIASTAGEASYARKHLRKWMKKRRVRLPLNQLPGRAWVQYEPLGVVLVIGPWNYPVYLTMGPLIAAIAAGNCAVLKPSELAPATSALLAALVPQYLDPSAVRVIEGDAQVTQELLALGFDHAVFTGGTEIGKKIMAAAAPTLTPVTLELGGKSPVIVDKDADLDVAARRIAWVKLLNSGQTCIAPDYVLAHAAIATELIAKIAECIVDFRSTAADPMMPIVNERQFARLVGYLSQTRGRVIGGAADESMQRLAPTVVVDPDPREPLMTDEIFGPILPVLTVESIDAAISFVNSRPKPLAMYAFTSSTRTATHLTESISAGGAVINHIAMHCLVPALPFGGVGDSGIGDYHGRWGFERLSHRKSVLSKSAKPDPRLVYPPYSSRDIKIMRKLF